MEPRISIITLGVDDLERSLRFYRDGLGFPTTCSTDKGVIFFQTRGTCLALFPREKLAGDVAPDFPNQRSGFSGFALAHSTRQQDEVDAVLQKAAAAGGRIEKAAQPTFWGGYGGYFSDPDGYLWEVAYGAMWEFKEDGSLVIP